MLEFLRLQGNHKIKGKQCGSLGKKCCYKKGIKYLFRAYPNF